MILIVGGTDGVRAFNIVSEMFAKKLESKIICVFFHFCILSTVNILESTIFCLKHYEAWNTS